MKMDRSLSSMSTGGSRALRSTLSAMVRFVSCYVNNISLSIRSAGFGFKFDALNNNHNDLRTVYANLLYVAPVIALPDC